MLDMAEKLNEEAAHLLGRFTEKTAEITCSESALMDDLAVIRRLRDCLGSGDWRGMFDAFPNRFTPIKAKPKDPADYPPELAEAVAQQVWLMHSRGVLHGDLNLSNFLCTKDEKGYRFTMIDTNRSHFTEGWPTDGQCLKNLVRLTHRRDLYEDLVRRYARLRGWDADSTARQALLLLERFENKCFRL